MDTFYLLLLDGLVKHYCCYNAIIFINNIFSHHTNILVRPFVQHQNLPSTVRFVSRFLFHPFIHRPFLFPSVLQQVSSAGHHEHTQVPDEEDAATDDQGERLQGWAGERAGLQGGAHRPERYHSIP